MPQGETLNRRRVLTGTFALIFVIGTTTGCDGEDAPIKAIAFVVDPTTAHASQQYAGALRELLGACVGLDAPVALFRVADERDDAVLLLWEGRINRQSLESALAVVPALFAPVAPDSGSDVATAMRAGRAWLKGRTAESGGRRLLVVLSDLIPDPRKDESGATTRVYDDPKTSTVANDVKRCEIHVFGLKVADCPAAEAAYPDARIHQEGVRLTPESLRLPLLRD